MPGGSTRLSVGQRWVGKARQKQVWVSVSMCALLWCMSSARNSGGGKCEKSFGLAQMPAEQVWILLQARNIAIQNLRLCSNMLVPSRLMQHVYVCLCCGLKLCEAGTRSDPELAACGHITGPPPLQSNITACCTVIHHNWLLTSGAWWHGPSDTSSRCTTAIRKMICLSGLHAAVCVRSKPRRSRNVPKQSTCTGILT